MKIDYTTLELGSVMIPQFFICAMVPDDVEGFYMFTPIGAHNQEAAETITKSIAQDHMPPFVAFARDRASAERLYNTMCNLTPPGFSGKSVLIEFNNGVIAELKRHEKGGEEVNRLN